MQRRSLAVGTGQLSVTLALLLWSLTVVPPALAERSAQTERPERADQIATGQSGGNGERVEKTDRHHNGAHDDDVESDDQDGQDGKDNLRCEGRQELVRIEEKVCPPTPHRPAIVVKRACCRNPAGKVHCRRFRHCQNRSPS